MRLTIQGLPYFTCGKIIKGFGRGSKQLGIPTANYADDVVHSLPDEINTGIYFGWAQIENGPVYKMVMSIGWNPFYQNKQKSMETHIMHIFEGDLYGKTLSVAILGFIRPEASFNNLDELIDAIKNDIEKSNSLLDKPEYQKFKTHSIFKLKNFEI